MHCVTKRNHQQWQVAEKAMLHDSATHTDSFRACIPSIEAVSLLTMALIQMRTLPARAPDETFRAKIFQCKTNNQTILGYLLFQFYFFFFSFSVWLPELLLLLSLLIVISTPPHSFR